MSDSLSMSSDSEEDMVTYPLRQTGPNKSRFPGFAKSGSSSSKFTTSSSAKSKFPKDPQLAMQCFIEALKNPDSLKNPGKICKQSNSPGFGSTVPDSKKQVSIPTNKKFLQPDDLFDTTERRLPSRLSSQPAPPPLSLQRLNAGYGTQDVSQNRNVGAITAPAVPTFIPFQGFSKNTTIVLPTSVVPQKKSFKQNVLTGLHGNLVASPDQGLIQNNNTGISAIVGSLAPHIGLLNSSVIPKLVDESHMKNVPDGSGDVKYSPPDPNLLVFDPVIGYRYDPTTGLHYDANSGYFFNSKLKVFLSWDFFKQTYLRVENPVLPFPVFGNQEEPIGGQQNPESPGSVMNKGNPIIKTGSQDEVEKDQASSVVLSQHRSRSPSGSRGRHHDRSRSREKRASRSERGHGNLREKRTSRSRTPTRRTPRSSEETRRRHDSSVSPVSSGRKRNDRPTSRSRETDGRRRSKSPNMGSRPHSQFGTRRSSPCHSSKISHGLHRYRSPDNRRTRPASRSPQNRRRSRSKPRSHPLAAPSKRRGNRDRRRSPEYNRSAPHSKSPLKSHHSQGSLTDKKKGRQIKSETPDLKVSPPLDVPLICLPPLSKWELDEEESKSPQSKKGERKARVGSRWDQTLDVDESSSDYNNLDIVAEKFGDSTDTERPQAPLAGLAFGYKDSRKTGTGRDDVKPTSKSGLTNSEKESEVDESNIESSKSINRSKKYDVTENKKKEKRSSYSKVEHHDRRRHSDAASARRPRVALEDFGYKKSKVNEEQSKTSRNGSSCITQTNDSVDVSISLDETGQLKPPSKLSIDSVEGKGTENTRDPSNLSVNQSEFFVPNTVNDDEDSDEEMTEEWLESLLADDDAGVDTVSADQNKEPNNKQEKELAISDTSVKSGKISSYRVPGDTDPVSNLFDDIPTCVVHVKSPIPGFVPSVLKKSVEDHLLENDIEYTKVSALSKNHQGCPYACIQVKFESPTTAEHWFLKTNRKITLQHTPEKEADYFLYYCKKPWECEHCPQHLNMFFRSLCYVCYRPRDGNLPYIKFSEAPSRFLGFHKLPSSAHESNVMRMLPKQIIHFSNYVQIILVEDPGMKCCSGLVIVEMADVEVATDFMQTWERRYMPCKYVEEDSITRFNVNLLRYVSKPLKPPPDLHSIQADGKSDMKLQDVESGEGEVHSSPVGRVPGDTDPLSDLYSSCKPDRFVHLKSPIQGFNAAIIKHSLQEHLLENSFIHTVISLFPKNYCGCPFEFLQVRFDCVDSAKQWFLKTNRKITLQLTQSVTAEYFLYYRGTPPWKCAKCPRPNSNVFFRSMCHMCFCHRNGDFSSFKFSEVPTRFLAFCKMPYSIKHDNVIDQLPRILHNNFKSVGIVEDPAMKCCCGVVIVEMPGVEDAKFIVQKANLASLKYVDSVSSDVTLHPRHSFTLRLIPSVVS